MFVPFEPLAEVYPLVSLRSMRAHAQEMEMALKLQTCESGAFFSDEAW